jgi:indole-3-glycerol phosphate synthase
MAQLIPLFRRIQERKALLICGDLTASEVTTLMDSLSPAGLALLIKVKTEDEADAVFRQITEG